MLDGNDSVFGSTHYVAVVGPHTAWSSSQSSGSKLFASDDHGILVVEVKNGGINWMEPRDLTVDEAIARLSSKSGPRISSGHDPLLANVVLANGEVAELPSNLSPELLHIALTEGMDDTLQVHAQGTNSSNAVCIPPRTFGLGCGPGLRPL